MYYKCDRCNKKANIVTGSMFNTQTICKSCKTNEMKHPRYDEAVKREYEEVLKGNFNYIGLAEEEGFKL